MSGLYPDAPSLGGNLYPVPVPTPGFPVATNYGDYIFYNGTDWTVGDAKISLGGFAGETFQQDNAVAVGYFAGNLNQGEKSIAIGYGSGQNNQGINSVAIGYGAGTTDQPSNTIILSATGLELSPTTADAFFVAPIRNYALETEFSPLAYNPTTGEIGYSATGNNKPIQYAEQTGSLAIPDTTPVLLATATITTVNESRIWAINHSTFDNTGTGGDNYILSSYLTINGTTYTATNATIPERFSPTVPSSTTVAVQTVTGSLVAGTYEVNVYAYADRANIHVTAEHSDLVVTAGFS